MNATLESIYEGARNLNYNEQLSLLERLAALIRKEAQDDKVHQHFSLLSLSGLGAEHWRNTDIDAYLKEERAW